MEDRSSAREVAREGETLYHTIPITGLGQFTIAIGAQADDPISLELQRGSYPVPYRSLLGTLQQAVPPGGRVLDLGAFIGGFSLGAAAAGYQVIAFEASPRNAALLNDSVRRNGFTNMKVVNAAVSDRPGTLRFHSHGPYGHVCSPSLATRGAEVPCITVDDVLQQSGWDRVDFVKIDIEGSEVAAIRGMTRLLSREDAPPIFYESNGHTLNFFRLTPNDLKAELERLGYRNYLVDSDRLVPVSAADFQALNCVDYLAVKRWPAGLGDRRSEAPLALQETIDKVLESSRYENPLERAYLARSLERAPREIRSDTRVIEVIASLRTDPDAVVRAAASWANRSKFPFSTIWKRWTSRAG